MEYLIRNSTAYKIFSGDRRANRLSHAYLLHFGDGRNLKKALKLFALEFFGADKSGVLGAKIIGENFVDLHIYPAEGEKYTAAGVSEIIEDSAMRPVEGSKKLYVLHGFENASALIQNKLLKTLEEPLEGIYFLLGATSYAPVLDTVKSRVKLLEIPPFTEDEIYSALEREGHSELNAAAAASAGGVLGAAENILSGGWFKEVADVAAEICATLNLADVGGVALKYGDTKYKTELLNEMQRLYFTGLTKGGVLPERLTGPAIVSALERIPAAVADVKFNAFFQGLLYNFMVKTIEENNKWLKLQA